MTRRPAPAGLGTTVEDLLAGRIAEILLERLKDQTRTVIREELAAAPPGEDRLLGLHEAAQVAGVKPATLQRRAARGSLPPGSTVRHGRRVLYRLRALLGQAAK